MRTSPHSLKQAYICLPSLHSWEGAMLGAYLLEQTKLTSSQIWSLDSLQVVPQDLGSNNFEYTLISSSCFKMFFLVTACWQLGTYFQSFSMDSCAISLFAWQQVATGRPRWLPPCIYVFSTVDYCEWGFKPTYTHMCAFLGWWLFISLGKGGTNSASGKKTARFRLPHRCLQYNTSSKMSPGVETTSSLDFDMTKVSATINILPHATCRTKVSSTVSGCSRVLHFALGTRFSLPVRCRWW